MAQTSLSCTLFDRPEQVTVAVAGQLDWNTCPTLRKAVKQALALHRATTVLDLTDVTFLSSEGVSELVKSNNHAISAGTHLAVVPSTHVRRILIVTGVDTLLDVRDTAQPAG
ncbi:STAS domain-containing protein [Micromonospora sp. CPCC 206061]|uniref:STAS domain-containing protein n=1 Tax=Micromonospora sp. CPCC 206061 TaxID=3122410 RepID=UPI002FEF450D